MYGSKNNNNNNVCLIVCELRFENRVFLNIPLND